MDSMPTGLLFGIWKVKKYGSTFALGAAKRASSTGVAKRHAIWNPWSISSYSLCSAPIKGFVSSSDVSWYRGVGVRQFGARRRE